VGGWAQKPAGPATLLTNQKIELTHLDFPWLFVYGCHPMSQQKSFRLKPKEIKTQWHLVNLDGKTLGRAATRIANLLRGKHKPTYTPGVDAGDFVVAINADKIELTGNKWDDKLYHRHSGYPGGYRVQTAKELKKKHPDALLMKAVKGMLPKNFLSDKLIKKLKVYPGSEHPHLSQKFQEIAL